MDGCRHIPSSHEVDKPISKKIGIIGGTDSSRGSGLSADKATILNLGGQPFPIISAITLQGNPSRIRIYSVPGLGFESQLNDLLEEDLDAIKIGMLPDESAVRMVGEFLDQSSCKKVVLDPVQKTSNGHNLISEKGWDCMVEELLPRISLLTPNLEEARQLLGLNSSEKIRPHSLVKKCRELGSRSILLKGGHGFGDQSIDLLADSTNPVIEYKWPRIPQGTEVRGTGCRLASAIACMWTKENDLELVVQEAGKYLQTYIFKNTP